MKMKIAMITMFAMVAATAGCFELKLVTTLNPDGSGKVAIESIAPSMEALSGMMGAKTNSDAKPPDTTEQAKSSVRELIKNSKGVDAWSDVSYEVLEDGRIKVKGTAYFSDLAKFKVKTQNTKLKWAKNDQGGMTLEIIMKDEGKVQQAGEKPKLSDEEVAEKVQQAKMQYQQMKPMMQAVLAKMKIEQTYHLPGKLDKVSGFEKIGDGAVKMSFTGQKMLGVMDKLMSDDKALALVVKAGKNPNKGGFGNDKMSEMMFGSKTLQAGVIGNLKPLFDYKAEVEKAKAGEKGMFEKLGIDSDAEKPANLKSAD